MKFINMCFLFLTLPFLLVAQNGASWNPEQPFVGDSITISFDPTQNSSIPNSTTTLVLHWGFNSYGDDWTPVPEDMWPEGSVRFSDGIGTRSPMILDGSIFRITVPTEEWVTSVHFVVNTGTPANPGGSWGNNNGSNWHIALYEGEITAEFIEPEINILFDDARRSPLFIDLNATINISGTAVVADIEIDSLELQVDDNRVAFESLNDTINYTYMASEFGPGMKEVSLIAYASTGISDTASLYFVIDPEVLDETMPAGTRPGINYVDANTVTLALLAPFKEHVYAIGDFNNWFVDPDYLMKRDSLKADSIYYWMTLSGLTPGEEYAFQYLVDGELRIADVFTHKILDPWNDQYIPESTYPDLKPYPDGITTEPVSILQTGQEAFNWVYTDTFTRPPKEKLVIYELLVRDFLETHDYLTLIDTLSYLETLGINAIELMPVNEFEGNVSWGYNPSFYFAPDKYYGTEEHLKMFIDECHRRGIAVIIDMVLNHSFGQSPMVRLYWDAENNRPAANNLWFNPVARHPFNVGYDFNHESRFTKTFVDTVNTFWLKEFKVDGFRFDLSKGFTQTNSGDNVGLWGQYDASRIAIWQHIANNIWEVEDDAYIILEHFSENNEETVLSSYGMMLWGNMNYNYNEATMGWNDNSDFSWGYFGSRGWSEPNLVTYMESHDEERLMHKNIEYGNGSGDYQIQDTLTAIHRMALAGAFFFTYPGPKMIWQFGERGFDYSINWPSGTDGDRLTPKPPRWDYMEQEARRTLFKTWAAMIKLRLENEVFTNPETSVVLWLGDGSGLKRIRLGGSGMNVSVIGNFGVTEQTIDPQFPYSRDWYDYMSGDTLYAGSGDLVSLLPGEYRIYTDVKLETPDLTGIDDSDKYLIGSYQLFQNYPNPFNPETHIMFAVPKMQEVQLTVYNMMGQKIRQLANRTFSSGLHTVKWNGTNDAGQQVASGIYIVRINAGDFVQSQKMVLVR